VGPVKRFFRKAATRIGALAAAPEAIVCAGASKRYDAAVMSIHDELVEELKDAMRAQDKRRLDVIRQIETEASRARAEKGYSGDPHGDDLYRAVISAYVKKMDKAREEFVAADRGIDQADKLAYEIGYLEQWMPTALSEDDTREVVRVAIMELKAEDPKQMGQVIGHIMKNGPAGLDGSLVSRLVKEALGA
jgi:uncharacterized protein YqeY